MTTDTIRWMEYQRQQAIDDGFEIDPDHVACIQPAPPEVVEMMLDPDLEEGGLDGRSEWLWIRTVDGTLIFGCFPCGETYFNYEDKREV